MRMSSPGVERPVAAESLGAAGALASAFCRLDLLAAGGSLLFVLLVCLPLLAAPKARTERLLCQANLRHISQAYHLWAGDHGDRHAFLVSTNAGGLAGLPVANNIWYQFAWISNELATPRVLACPADTNTIRVAQDFSSNPDGGFLYPAYRNNAVSYFLGLHAFFATPYAMLSGDRNLQVAQTMTSCVYAQLNGVQGLNLPGSQWTDAIHGPGGNLLFNDGRVETSSQQHLQQAIRFVGDDNASVHILLPR